MKRYFLSLFSCLVVCSCVSACSANLPKKTFVVSFDYGNVVKEKAWLTTKECKARSKAQKASKGKKLAG